MVKYINTLDLDFIFTALSNPTRRGILLELQSGARSAQDLATPFTMSLPAISKHLRVLEKAHLIKRVVKGRQHFFTVEPKKLKEASDWVKKFEVFWNEKLNNLDLYLNKEKD